MKACKSRHVTSLFVFFQATVLLIFSAAVAAQPQEASKLDNKDTLTGDWYFELLVLSDGSKSPDIGDLGLNYDEQTIIQRNKFAMPFLSLKKGGTGKLKVFGSASYDMTTHEISVPGGFWDASYTAINNAQAQINLTIDDSSVTMTCTIGRDGKMKLYMPSFNEEVKYIVLVRP